MVLGDLRGNPISARHRRELVPTRCATFSTTARTSARPAFAPHALSGQYFMRPPSLPPVPVCLQNVPALCQARRTIVGPRDVPSPRFASDLSMRSARAPRALFSSQSATAGAASAAGVRRAKVERPRNMVSVLSELTELPRAA